MSLVWILIGILWNLKIDLGNVAVLTLIQFMNTPMTPLTTLSPVCVTSQRSGRGLCLLRVLGSELVGFGIFVIYVHFSGMLNSLGQDKM